MRYYKRAQAKNKEKCSRKQPGKEVAECTLKARRQIAESHTLRSSATSRQFPSA